MVALKLEMRALNLLILGYGGHGRVVMETAHTSRKYEIIAFLDDRYNGTDPQVIGRLSDYEEFQNDYPQAFVAIGNPAVREQWQEKLTGAGYILPTLIHPNACISPSSFIGQGTVVMMNAIMQSGAKIGNGCIVSAGAVVDHDAVVGDFCHINAGAVVAAGSRVPNGVKVDYNEVFRNDA